MAENDTSSGATVIVACMDRRLVEILKLFDSTTMPLDEKLKALSDLFVKQGEVYQSLRALLQETNGRNVIVLANAGANVNGLPNTLQEIKGTQQGIQRLIVFTHTNCGGMATVATGLFNGNTEDKNPIFAHLGGSEYASAYDKASGIKEIRNRVEQLNPMVQEKRAAAWCGNVEVVQIDVDDLRLREAGDEHWLVLARYGIGTYSANFKDTPRDQTYGIVARRMDIGRDMEIAATIGMDVTLDRRRQKIR